MALNAIPRAIFQTAGFIISGDHHLTDLKTFRGIPIVNPATFLKLIAELCGKSEK